MFTMEGYRLERGLVWPADDTECARVVFDTLDDCEAAIRLCRERRLVVQAGGNCGVWPAFLAGEFDRVVTFEPDPANFRALVVNTAAFDNVLALPAALSTRGGRWCDLDRRPGNCGAHQIERARLGAAPVMALDDLSLPACDLIYLDIEGSEYDALAGARETIERFLPVVAFEDKGLSSKYGVAKGEAVRLLEGWGYRLAAERRRDFIMVADR